MVPQGQCYENRNPRYNQERVQQQRTEKWALEARALRISEPVSCQKWSRVEIEKKR